MKLPEKYEAAQRALAAAVRIDEVKDIYDKALALEACAYQSKNYEMAADAVELRLRATRRLGQLITILEIPHQGTA
jgi:hypothetical protein